VGVLVLLVLVWIGDRSEGPEPVFQSKRVTTWALDLSNASAAVRAEAGLAIARFDSNALPALVRLLRTRDPILAVPLKRVSRRIPDRVSQWALRFVDPFAGLQKRICAAQALWMMGLRAKPALHALCHALHDDPGVSWYAALALSNLGEPGMAALIDALGPSTRLRPAGLGSVCYALRTQGPAASNAVPALARLLQHSDVDLRAKAASALAQIGRPAVPPLTQALSDKDPEIRLLAVTNLAAIGPLARDAVPALIEVSAKDLPELRVAAVDSLSQIRPSASNVVAALERALRDSVHSVRVHAIQDLSRSPRSARAATSELARVAKDPSPEIRSQAVALLGAMGEPSQAVIAALTDALNDENQTIRIRASQALKQLGVLSSANGQTRSADILDGR
jgi:HEAT repeat protein